MNRLSLLLDEILEFDSDRPRGYVDNPLYAGKGETSVQEIPIKKITSMQNALSKGIVKKYQKKPGHKLPWVRKIGSKFYIEDGNHRIAAKKANGEDTVKVRIVGMSHLLDEILEFQLPGDKPTRRPADAPLPTFNEGQLLDYNVQRHEAKRAGLHRDIRIGNKRHGLLSWATRKPLPGPGEKIGIHQQPTHPHSYLGWSGEIKKGYGAGVVSSEQLSKALVTKSTPDELHATISQRGSPRVAFARTRGGWVLARARSISPGPEPSKPATRSATPQQAPQLLKKLQPGASVQPKIDGALTYVSVSNRPEIFSHRKSKETGQNIVHTERFFKGRPTANIPSRLHGKTLLAETYGVKGGKSIPPQDLGGILNAHLATSLDRQKKEGVKLKAMPFDIAGQENTPYHSRLGQVKEILKYLPKDRFHAPEEAQTPQSAQKLFDRIRSGKHPLTKEGIVIHPPQGKMTKIKNVEEANVKIHSLFPGTGKFKDSYGGFYYPDKKGNPLGRVGTGFTDQTRADLPQYVGRTARVRYQEKFKSGRLRAPAFVGVDESK